MVHLRAVQPRARLLEDGHVEFTHCCNGEDVAGILPMPPWRVTKTDPLTVEPSVSCAVCGVHGFIGHPLWSA
jgi:hypothetical protein